MKVLLRTGKRPQPIDVAGSGPEAVPADAQTYSELQTEAERRDLLARGLGRWGGEARPSYTAGTVPKLSGASPWATGDRLGPEPPTGQRVDGDDPSGVNRHRGPG